MTIIVIAPTLAMMISPASMSRQLIHSHQVGAESAGLMVNLKIGLSLRFSSLGKIENLMLPSLILACTHQVYEMRMGPPLPSAAERPPGQQ